MVCERGWAEENRVEHVDEGEYKKEMPTQKNKNKKRRHNAKNLLSVNALEALLLFLFAENNVRAAELVENHDVERWMREWNVCTHVCNTMLSCDAPCASYHFFFLAGRSECSIRFEASLVVVVAVAAVAAMTAGTLNSQKTRRLSQRHPSTHTHQVYIHFFFVFFFWFVFCLFSHASQQQQQDDPFATLTKPQLSTAPYSSTSYQEHQQQQHHAQEMTPIGSKSYPPAGVSVKSTTLTLIPPGVNSDKYSTTGSLYLVLCVMAGSGVMSLSASLALGGWIGLPVLLVSFVYLFPLPSFTAYLNALYSLIAMRNHVKLHRSKF